MPSTYPGQAPPCYPAPSGRHPGMIFSVVAASSGSTISGTPLCHWPTRNSPSGRPVVPAQRPEDRVDLVLAQPVGELHLTLALDRADPLHGGLEHLRRRVRVRRVLRHLLPPNISWYFATNSSLPGVVASFEWLTA